MVKHQKVSKYYETDCRAASEFSEIWNDRVLLATKCKVAFSILTVISYDSVVLALIAEN